jgi:hypothetical protein
LGRALVEEVTRARVTRVEVRVKKCIFAVAVVE